VADPAIVKEAARGDREAFDVLVQGSIDRLYAVARLILRDVDLSEDAVQEALVRCWQQLPKLRDPANFDAWLHRLLVNAALDQFRASRRFRASISLIRLEPAVPDASGQVDDRDQLARAFERLRPEQRAVLVLYHYQGFSIADLAATLAIPAGTAKSRLHYAIEAMRAAVEADARATAKQRDSA
jgi:RNA polymerase sigma-70 factor (ECF subfamily)